MEVRDALLHVELWMGKRLEAKLGVEAVGVLCNQMLPTQTLQAWMSGETAHRGFREPAAAMRLEDINIAKVSERRIIGDHADQANLFARRGVDAKAEGVFGGARDDFKWNAFGPIAARKVGVHRA
jgi:hypothetical protein